MIYDVRELEIFSEVAGCGSFTMASARLGISIASVSRSVARLEQRIDTRLFNRNTRRLNLTEDGQSFLDNITEGLALLDSAHERLRGVHDRVAGKLRVLLPNTFCKNYVVPALGPFLELYPALQLEIHVTDFGEDLLGGNFDVSAQFGALPETGYISRILGRTPVFLAASPAYLARRGVPRSVEDLDEHIGICFGPSLAEPFAWQLYRRDEDPARATMIKHQPQGRLFIVEQLDTAIIAAVNGLGITPVDLGAAMRYLQSGELVIVLPDYEVFGGTLHLLYPHRDHLPNRSRVFIDFMINLADKSLKHCDFDPHAFACPRHDHDRIKELAPQRELSGTA